MRYYVVHVSNRAPSSKGSPYYWSRPFASTHDACAYAKAKHEDDATLSMVVEMADDGSKRVMMGSIRLTSARRIIEHFLDIEDMIDEEGEPE